METYNEKLIRLNNEITEKREAAFQRFNEQQKRINDAKEIDGRRYDETKKNLQIELDKAIEQQNELKKNGFADFSDAIAATKATIRDIHKRQFESKTAFMNKIREYAKARNELVLAYREEKLAIGRYKSERLLQIEAEERERKELLSLSNEEKEN